MSKEKETLLQQKIVVESKIATYKLALKEINNQLVALEKQKNKPCNKGSSPFHTCDYCRIGAD